MVPFVPSGRGPHPVKNAPTRLTMDAPRAPNAQPAGPITTLAMLEWAARGGCGGHRRLLMAPRSWWRQLRASTKAPSARYSASA